LCSKKCHFDVCVSKILQFLDGAGYPARCFPSVGYLGPKRDLLLSQIHNRKPKDKNSAYRVTAEKRQNVVLSVPFSPQLDQLGLRNLFRASVGSIIPIDLRLGWSVKVNSMRRLYRFNWPSVLSMGFG